MKRTILFAVAGALALGMNAMARDVGGAGFRSSKLGTAMVTTDDAGTATLEIDAVSIRDVLVTSGTASVSTVTAEDADYGNMKKTTLTLNGTEIKIVAESQTNAWGSVKIYDFPEGRLLVHGVTVKNIILAPQTNKLPLASGGDWALGTVAASTNALAGTMVDLCPSTSADPINGTNSSALAAAAQFDGTTTAKDMYLNFGVDMNDFLAPSTTATNTVSGVITIHWTNLGDY